MENVIKSINHVGAQ